jgi:hypothetical protein
MSDDGVVLCSGLIELVVCPHTGKITNMRVCSSTVDKNSLLVTEPLDSFPVKDAHEDDIFDIRSAWGIDECFPYVGSYPECGVRDHGWIWGVSSKAQVRQDEVVNEWTLPKGEVFRRSIVSRVPSGGAIGCFDFSVTHPRSVLTFQDGLGCLGIFASHALFSAEAGDVLEVWDGEEGRRERKLCWRGVFPAPDKRVARKFFVSGQKGLVAILFRKNLGIQIRIACQKDLPHLGIWWCNNGWGDGRTHQTIGIEPTNALTDGPVFQQVSSCCEERNPVTERYSYEISWLAR